MLSNVVTCGEIFSLSLTVEPELSVVRAHLIKSIVLSGEVSSYGAFSGSREVVLRSDVSAKILGGCT